MGVNYLVVNDGTDFGNKSGQLASVVQGETGLVLVVDVQDQAGGDFDVTGATSIIGRLNNIGTGAVTTVTGTISVANGGFSWPVSAADIGTYGEFELLVQFTLSGVVKKTHPVKWVIIEDPAATAVAGDGVNYVDSTGDTMTGPLILSGDPTVDLGAATKQYVDTVDGVIDTHIADTSNPHSVTAAQVDALPKDAGLLAKTTTYELAAGDEGKVIRCSGTFTVTCPDGLDSGFQCMISNISSGTITIAAETTLQGIGTQLTSQWAACYVVHIGSDVWEVYGGAE